MSCPLQEVVISGIGGKFPECSSVEEFKENLFSKTNLLHIGLSRHNSASDGKPTACGKIPDSDKFDGNFFGMPSRLVRNCDPMKCLMMETTFEAIVDAGLNPFTMKGKNICVVTATGISDSEGPRILEGVNPEGWGMIGISRAMMANRISYTFNFTGPSYNCDCSWVAAVQGLDVAASLVARGEVEGAVVASANLLFHNVVDISYRGMDLLASDDNCTPYDAEAQGFARSESVVSFFIQRAQDAKRNYGTILTARSQFTGDKFGSYVQLNPHMELFFKQLYGECKVDPADVSYIEGGGFCEKDFDTEELNTLSKVFCHPKKSQVLIGSVMGNMGNSEAPSGLVSMTKAIIALEGGVIPPTINHHNPNPRVPALVNGKLKVVVEPTALPGDLVAVNSFSFNGSMGHVLLKRNNKEKICLSTGELPADGLPRLVILQSRHEEGAKSITDKLSSMPIDAEFISLVNDVFKTPIPAYLWRSYAILPAVETKSSNKIQIFNYSKRPVWYIFSGMGSQWIGMGQDLLRVPVFAAAIDRCDQVLRPRGLDIKHILTTDDSAIFDNILNCFVGIAAVQIGLVDILTTLGVTPDGMIGHSVGELGCAYADGCITAEEMVLASFARGRASIESELISGMMAAVGKGYQEIRDHLPATMDVACHNSATSCTLSGPTEDVMAYVEQLKKDGVFAKAVSAGGIAYHSRYIEPVAPKLLEYLRETIPNPKARSSRWVSSSVPQSQWDTEDAKMSSAEYHTNNLLSPVLFQEACQHLPEDAILVEIAPHGLLQAILRRSISDKSLSVALTNRTAESNVHHLLGSVGKLYLNNVAVDVNKLYPPVHYPVSRGTPSLASLITWAHTEPCYLELYSLIAMSLRKGRTERSVNINQEVADFKLWKDHCVGDQVMVPLSQLLIYSLELIFSSKHNQLHEISAVFEEITSVKNLFTEEFGTSVLVTCTAGGKGFEASLGLANELNRTNILVGRLQESSVVSFTLPQRSVDKADFETVSQQEIYCFLSHFGYHLGPQFQLIKDIQVCGSEYMACVEWTGSMVTFLDSLFNIVVFIQTNDKQRLFLPSYFEKMTVHTPLLNLLVKGTLVDVHYDRRCNRLVCEYVELLGLTLSSTSLSSPRSLVWRELKFEHFFVNKNSLDEFLTAILQLSSWAGLDTCINKACYPRLLKLGDDIGTSSLVSHLVNKLVETEAFVSTELMVNDVRAKELLSSAGHQSYLVVGEHKSLANLASSVPVQDHVFYLTQLNETLAKNQCEDLKPIFIHKGQTGTLALLKKVNIYIRAKVFRASNNKWLSDLRQKISQEEGDDPVYVVCRSLVPREVLPTLATEPYVHRIRTVFIRDHDAPQFSLSSPLYLAQLSLGLPVNILSGGVWGSLTANNINVTPLKSKLDSFFKRRNDGLDIACVGLNTTTFNLPHGDVSQEAEVKYVDYSGWSAGEPLMGLAQLNSDTNTLVVDPILRWAVPSNWTMEDAASVPATYALAYYCTHMKARLKDGENILIHAGMSVLGQAVIALALSVGGNVFTTVTKEEEALQLLKLFPSLNPKHVLVFHGDDTSVPLRMLTAGVGMHVIINCLQGRGLQSSIKSMGHACRFLHLASIKLEDRESVGMFVFVTNASFHGISFDNVANCSTAWKHELREKVQRGIEQGIVKPLRRRAFPLDQQTKAFNNFKTMNGEQKTVLLSKQRSPRVVRYDPDELVLIAGTNTQLWLDVAEWLVTRGARRLVVLTEEEELVGSHGVRFNNLISRTETTIFIASITQTDTLDDALGLLKNFLNGRMISSIFCVQMHEGSSRVRNLDQASRQLLPELRQFVCLLSEGAGVCESRAASGLSACSVQSHRPLHRPAMVLPYLSTLLAESSSHSRLFVVSDDRKELARSDVLESQSVLRSSLAELNRLGSAVSDSPCFAEVVTRSPRYDQDRHPLLPVFVVPRLGSESLQPLFRHLIHPAFCASLPARVESVNQFAEYLLKSIIQHQVRGPYNIVGELWNGAVALILGCLLEQHGHKVKLFLLEGAPTIAQDSVGDLCERYNTDFGTSLLAATLDLSSQEVKTVSQLKEWDDKLETVVARVPVSVRDSVSRVLASLYSQLSALLQFQTPSQLFQGNVTLVTAKKNPPSTIAELAKCCQHAPRVVVTGDQDHHQLINNFSVATVINENTAYHWKS